MTKMERFFYNIAQGLATLFKPLVTTAPAKNDHQWKPATVPQEAAIQQQPHLPALSASSARLLTPENENEIPQEDYAFYNFGPKKPREHRISRSA